MIDGCCIADTERFTGYTQVRHDTGQIGRHIDLGRAAVRDGLEGLDALELQYGFPGIGFVQRADTACLRFINEGNGFRLTFGKGDLSVTLCLGSEDLRLLVTFRTGDNRLLMRLCLEDGLTAFTLGAHLLGHDLLDLLRRLDVLDLDTGHLDSPGIGCLVQDRLHLGVDGLTRGERLVELHVADDVAQRRRGQVLQAGEGILDTVREQLGIENLHEHDGIDLHGDVILRDDGLRREIQHLLL